MFLLILNSVHTPKKITLIITGRSEYEYLSINFNIIFCNKWSTIASKPLPTLL